MKKTALFLMIASSSIALAACQKKAEEPAADATEAATAAADDASAAATDAASDAAAAASDAPMAPAS